MNRRAFMKILGVIAVIALCIGACCACDSAFEHSKESSAATSENTWSAPASRLETVKALLNDEGTDAGSAAEDLFGLSVDSELPEAFVQEALGGTAFEETYVSGSTISLIYPASCSEAASYCTETLESKGWYALDQNSEVMSSFAKTEGTYRWLVLQYLAFDNKTVVLVNIIDPK